MEGGELCHRSLRSQELLPRNWWWGEGWGRPAEREEGDGSLEKVEPDYRPQSSYRREDSGSADASLQKNGKPTSAFFSPQFEGCFLIWPTHYLLFSSLLSDCKEKLWNLGGLLIFLMLHGAFFLISSRDRLVPGCELTHQQNPGVLAGTQVTARPFWLQS